MTLFDTAIAQHRSIRLLCASAVKVSGTVCALVDGIEVARVAVNRYFEIGEALELPTHYFPMVALPTKLRFLIGGVEIAPPLTINTQEEVSTILGNSEIIFNNVVLDGGLLRGVVSSKTNGLLNIALFARLNGVVVRGVTLEPPQAIDEGGAAARFAVPIRPSDLIHSGLIVDICLPGIDHPLHTYAYTRSDVDAGTRHLIEMQESIRKLQKSNFLQVEMLRDSVDRQLRMQQERIDTFIEHAVSTFLDFAAAGPTNPRIFEISSSIKQLGFSLTQSFHDDKSQVQDGQAQLPLESDGFVLGWYDVESNEDGQFRWMAQTGLLRNPRPWLALDRIELDISQVYGTDTPFLQASLDGQQMQTVVKAAALGFLVSLLAPHNGPMHGDSLFIESYASGCPASDTGTNDQRIISIAVNQVRFLYKTAPDAVVDVA